MRILFSIPFYVGFGKMNRAALSKALASSVSVTEVLVIPSATQLCYDSCALRVVSCSSKKKPYVGLLVKDVHFGEGGILEFPTRSKSDQSVLVVTVASVKMSSSSTTISHSASEKTDEISRGSWMTASSCSSFLGSGVSDTSESVCHLAESTLLSHDVVSDNFTWPTSDLIVRLTLLVGIRHRHRCERASRKILLSRSTPRASSLTCRRPYCDSVEPDDLEKSLSRAPLPCTTRV